jgi:hypothetical protein
LKIKFRAEKEQWRKIYQKGLAGGCEKMWQMSENILIMWQMYSIIWRFVPAIKTILLNYNLKMRLWQRSKTERAVVEPDILYQNYVLPPMSTTDAPVDCVLTKFVRSAMNKVKCPIYSLCWTPEGKRLITGASSGEFTLWNGTAFNFETILQAIIFTYLSFKFIFLGP